MADKAPGKNMKKAAQSIKERRAEKRAKNADSSELIRKRKRS